MRVVAAFAHRSTRPLRSFFSRPVWRRTRAWYARPRASFPVSTLGPGLICRKEVDADAWSGTLHTLVGPSYLDDKRYPPLSWSSSTETIRPTPSWKDRHVCRGGAWCPDYRRHRQRTDSILLFRRGRCRDKSVEEEARHMKEADDWPQQKRCRQMLKRRPDSITWRSAVDLLTAPRLRAVGARRLLRRSSRREHATLFRRRSGRARPEVWPTGACHPRWREMAFAERILIGWKDLAASSAGLLTPSHSCGVRGRSVSLRSWRMMRAQDRLRLVCAMWHPSKSHSVEALPQVVTPRKDALRAFADTVSEFKPDWIVAGAYGHSRLGEWIFGGVTRYLLRQSDRPVFLSRLKSR